MFPQTSAGVTSVEERTNEESMGFRRHCEVLAMEVAVRRVSGCRMRRLEVEEIVQAGRRVVACVPSKEPMTLIVSPNARAW
jgi:hypothetical protein